MKTVELQGVLDNLKGDYSIIIKDLSRGEILHSINPEKSVRSASTIKISILLEVMAQVKAGKLRLEQDILIKDSDKVPYSVISRMKTDRMKLEDMALLMMSHSDNTATNILIDLAGMENINARIKSISGIRTILCRKMMDFESAAKGLDNYVCAEDIAQQLELIYRGTFLGDREICEKMKGFMSTGANREFMDRYFPEELKVMHKTGELEHLDHDCGVIYLADYVREHMQGTESYEHLKKGNMGDYLLIILGENFEDNMKGRENISRISEWVYHQALKGWK